MFPLFHHLLHLYFEFLCIPLLLVHHPLDLVHIPASLLLEFGLHLLLNSVSLLEECLFLLHLNLVSLPLVYLQDLIVSEVPVDTIDVLLDLLLRVVGYCDLLTTKFILVTFLRFFLREKKGTS